MRASHKLYLAAAVAVTVGAAGARADSPLYSFETLYNSANPPQPDPSGTHPDGFGPNGGGTTIAQDTIGATDGTHSLLYSMVAGATFTGAQTELINGSILNDPNTTAVAVDLTIPATGTFSGAFARIGVSEFGNPDDPEFGMGLQVQTAASSESNIALTPGTYHLVIPLIARSNPITFDTNVTFASCFGSDPSSQMTPTGFEFYINKSNDSPLTVYLDNVTAVTNAPPPPSFVLGDLEGLGGFDASLTPLFFELLNDGDDAYIDNHPDFSANFMATYGMPLTHDDESEVLDNGVANFSGLGGFDASNIPDWFNLLNGGAGLATAPAFAAVPEPATFALLAAAAPALMLRRRSKARQSGK
jgi:hypothetical protein